MAKLLIATTNSAKFEEASAVLKTEGLEILSLKDFPNIQPVPETGSTYGNNAILKAKGYFSQTNVPCLADDSGFEVVYLGGLPGVQSHRGLGYEATDQELAGAIIHRLKGVPLKKRGARLGGFVAFWNGANLLTQENWINGYIAYKIMGEINPGFPYRVILMIPQFNKPYSALSEEEHKQVNFRRKNLNALKPKILKLLGNHS